MDFYTRFSEVFKISRDDARRAVLLAMYGGDPLDFLNKLLQHKFRSAAIGDLSGVDEKIPAGPWRWNGEDYRGGWRWQILVDANGAGLVVAPETPGEPSQYLRGYVPLDPKHCQTGFLKSEESVEPVHVFYTAAYALHSAKFRFAQEHGVHYQTKVAHPEWPWHHSWWKPKDPRRDLIRAAALIQAEILRLDRAAILGVLSEPMDLWTVASRLGRDKTSLSFKSLAGAMDTLLSDGKVLWDSSTNIYRRAENV